MTTKKKAAKSAKNAIQVKKAVPAKKAAKPAHPIKPAPKKAATKLAPKKPVVAPKKPVVVKKAPVKPVAKKTVPIVKPASPKPEVKKTVSKVPEKKEENLKPVIQVAKKPEVKKVVPPAKPVKVVIPDMKTKTVRKYEPEFTKSVLDTLQQDQTGPTMRYSDGELVEFRELIMKKLDAAKKELTYLQGLITRKDEMGGDNDDARYMTMEDGSMSMEREQLSQMASRPDHIHRSSRKGDHAY